MVTSPETRRRYRILGTIGKGGFGTVFKAELMGESGFSKVVALKVLNPDVSEVKEIAERMRDEARVLGLVHHRSIVQVDALLQLEGRWTIVMEYVNGVDLKHLIREGPVPAGPALEIATEVASALRAAKEQPGPDGKPLCLLHRDIKPPNIQLTSAGEVKVLDFGTARANFASREAKTQEMAFGTLDYMAPERLEFVDVPAGDVYALGIVLFEMLTGTSLGHTSPRPTWHQQLRQEAVTRLHDAGVHEGVIALIKDMLAFEADDRPDLRTVEQRGRDLRVACGGPWLSDWAADIVPRILSARTTTDADETTGTILEEGATAHTQIPGGGGSDTAWVRAQGGQQVPPTPAPQFESTKPVVTVSPHDVLVGRPQSASRTGLWAALAGLAALVLFGGLAVFAATTFLPEGTLPWAATTEPVEEDEPPAPEPTAVAEPAAPEPVVPEPVAPEPAAPEPVATPTPVTPSPTVARGRVVVEGDATDVTLLKGTRRVFPGRVPVGTYTIEATFEGRGTVNAGTVTITDGGTVTLDCQRAFARCTVRP